MTDRPLHDSKTNLLEAAQAALKDREEKAVTAALAARSVPQRRRIGLLTVIGVAGLVLLVVQPSWLAGPKSVPPEPPRVAAAALRIAMIRQRQQLFNYANIHRRFPLSLGDAGDSLPGVIYNRRGDSAFTLIGSVGDSMIVLHSGDSQTAFLGNSIRIIKNRGTE
jgi:hypothetical protein